MVALARVLREAGLDVPTSATVAFAGALDALGAAERAHVYWAARLTLVHRPEDVVRFDECFAALVDGAGASPAPSRDPAPVEVAVGLDAPGPETSPAPAAPPPAPAPVVRVQYSPTEVLRHRDFAAYTPREHAEARRLMVDLRLVGARRRTRRLEPAARGRPDLRRTLRRAFATGGEVVERRYRAPSTRPRRIVLLCDVSGSMEPYARMLVRFLHAAVAGRARVEAFALGTRLTRLTRELASRDPDAALAAAARRVVDWSGGTRLGEGLRHFNDRWGSRGVARGAVVVIISDGWDRGRPDLLAAQMARLARVAHRVVWVNPLKALPGYAPLARGMAAALPFVDDFVAGHSLASLESLAEVIAR